MPCEERRLPDVFGEWRIKRELRRSCGYAVVGWPAVIVASFVAAPKPLGNAAGVFLLLWAPLIGLWVYTATWRLRLDQRGISRRRFGRWTCWEWSLFLTGSVKPGATPAEFICPLRPWWDRRLWLNHLETETAETLAQHLNAMIKATSAASERHEESIPFANSIVLYCGLTEYVEVTREGVKSHGGAHVLWGNVHRFRLLRREHGDAYYYRVEFCPLQGKTVSAGVNWVTVNGGLQWNLSRRNAIWPRQLASIVPADKWQIYRTDGELQCVEEADFRVDHWRRRETRLRWMRNFGAPAMLVLGVVGFSQQIANCWNGQFFPPIWKPIALACLILCAIQPAVLVAAMAGYALRLSSRRRREAEEERECWRA